MAGLSGDRQDGGGRGLSNSSLGIGVGMQEDMK